MAICGSSFGVEGGGEFDGVDFVGVGLDELGPVLDVVEKGFLLHASIILFILIKSKYAAQSNWIICGSTLFQIMAFFHSQPHSDQDDSLPSLEGINESLVHLPPIKSFAELLPYEPALEHKVFNPSRTNIRIDTRPSTQPDSKASRKVKWSPEEKKKYWVGVLDFMIEYPFHRLSWEIEKSKEPAFFKYMEKKVITKNKKQCKCFDQNQRKKHFLRSSPTDIPQLTLQYLSKFLQEPEISSKLSLFHQPTQPSAAEDHIGWSGHKHDTFLQSQIMEYMAMIDRGAPENKVQLQRILDLRGQLSAAST